MYAGKLLVLSAYLTWLCACDDSCLHDSCIRNEFVIHAGHINAIHNTTGNKINGLVAAGPCTVDERTYDCMLSNGCDSVAILSTGAGTCHLDGKATLTGSFVVDVAYSSCKLSCGAGSVFITDHYDVFLFDNRDAGTTAD